MKRILSLLLTLTLVFIFVACTDKKDNTSEQTTSTITQTENKNTGNNTNTETTDSNTTDKSSNDTETTSSKINKPNTNNSNRTSSDVTVADRMEEAEISTIVLIKEGNDKNCHHTLTQTIDHRTKNAPSCTTDGYIISQCQQCGCEWEYFVKAFGHSIDSHCTKKPTCVMCKKEFEGDVNPNDHRYIEYNTKVGYVAPTCCSEGYEGHKKVCMNCNFVFEKGKTLPIDPNACYRFEYRNKIEATCSKEGYWGDKYCLDCNKFLGKGRTDPATGRHTGGEATCTKKANCSICGITYGNVNKNNHKHTEIKEKITPQYDCCTGYTGDTYCTDCNTKISSGSKINAKKEHNYKLIESSKPGYLVYKKSQCQDCGNISIVSIKA